MSVEIGQGFRHGWHGASRELHERGIDYVLMNDSDWGADDIREDPAAWGFKEIARGYGARIYKVVTE